MMKRMLSALLLGLMIATAACGGGGSGSNDAAIDDGSDFSTGGGTTARTVIDRYVNNFIIDVYQSLDSRAAALQQAARNLVNETSEENLQAARAAWVATRVPWENSETALFGPVDFYGFDPAMDSWPVNRTDLDAVLASGTPLTASTVANFDTTLKGFHTIEYILWGIDSLKTAAQLTPREGDYLIATTDELKSITSALLAAWVTGINGQRPYALEMTDAGQGSTTFPSERTAVEQMVQGMILICDEVANGKIADPFDARNPDIVESQFSFNSTADFANNIRGAQQAYDIAVGLLVSQENPGLDAKVRSQFIAAIAATEQIPEPFRNSILNTSNDRTIVAAQQAIRTVANTLQAEVLPEVLSE